MSDHDDTINLEAKVDAILAKKELDTFADYWNLGKELINGIPVRAYYIRTEVGYVNLAVLTDNLIIDIEKIENDANPGGVSIGGIKSVSAVYFRPGPVPTVPDSETSQLTVVALRTGVIEPGFYWVAKSDSEREGLIRFGKALLRAVNAP